MSAAVNADQFEQFQQVMRLGVANGCTQQALDIMKFLRNAVAPTVEMAIFEAWQMISAGELSEARHILEAAADSDPAHCEVKALLATALFFSEDELWHRYAYEVEQSPVQDEAAIAMVGKLKAAAESGLSVSYLRRLMLRRIPAEVAPEVAEVV